MSCSNDNFVTFCFVRSYFFLLSSLIPFLFQCLSLCVLLCFCVFVGVSVCVTISVCFYCSLFPCLSRHLCVGSLSMSISLSSSFLCVVQVCPLSPSRYMFISMLAKCSHLSAWCSSSVFICFLCLSILLCVGSLCAVQ